MASLYLDSRGNVGHNLRDSTRSTTLAQECPAVSQVCMYVCITYMYGKGRYRGRRQWCARASERVSECERVGERERESEREKEGRKRRKEVKGLGLKSVYG
jgi:hypothetical protein